MKNEPVPYDSRYRYKDILQPARRKDRSMHPYCEALARAVIKNLAGTSPQAAPKPNR